MKVLVPVKRVIDYAVKIRILPNKKGVETSKLRRELSAVAFFPRCQKDGAADASAREFSRKTSF